MTYSLISSLLMLINGTPVRAAVTDPVVNVLDEVNHYVNVAGTVQEDLTTVASRLYPGKPVLWEISTKP
ncbi:MAG: hypothetical protein ACLU99_01950 [Alphaproteobacteria bacterium]